MYTGTTFEYSTGNTHHKVDHVDHFRTKENNVKRIIMLLIYVALFIIGILIGQIARGHFKQEPPKQELIVSYEGNVV